MRTFGIILLICLMVVGVGVGVYEGVESYKLKKEITQLRMLKTHFYDFRNRIYLTVPVDYLSAVTIDDFDFDKYLED